MTLLLHARYGFLNERHEFGEGCLAAIHVVPRLSLLRCNTVSFVISVALVASLWALEVLVPAQSAARPAEEPPQAVIDAFERFFVESVAHLTANGGDGENGITTEEQRNGDEFCTLANSVPPFLRCARRSPASGCCSIDENSF